MLAKVSAPSAEARPMQSSATGWVGKIRKISQAQERLGFGAGCKPEVMISCEATSNNPKVASSMSYPEGWRSRAGRILSPVRTIPTYHTCLLGLRWLCTCPLAVKTLNPKARSRCKVRGGRHGATARPAPAAAWRRRHQ